MCSLGLPYKLFADRHELVAEILRGEADFQSALAGYLAAEQERGRVDTEVAVEAVAFLLAGSAQPGRIRPGLSPPLGHAAPAALFQRPAQRRHFPGAGCC